MAPRFAAKVPKLGRLADWAAQAVAIIVALVVVYRGIRPLVTIEKPGFIPDDRPGVRYGVPDDVRHQIFDEVAAAEPEFRQNGARDFPGQPWSIEDHRCAYERDLARSIASRRGLNLTQVYLIIDQGVREKWPGPDGKPLQATVPPLAPRRKL